MYLFDKINKWYYSWSQNSKFVLLGVHVSFMCVFINVYWCPTRCPYQMMFVSFNSNTTVSRVEQELLTLPEHLSSSPVLVRIRVARSLVFFVMFGRLLFVLLYFFFGPLYCPVFFDLRLFITLLASSNFLTNWEICSTMSPGHTHKKTDWEISSTMATHKKKKKQTRRATVL